MEQVSAPTGKAKPDTRRIIVLDKTGHMEVTWDASDRAQITQARETFEFHKGRGATIFETDGAGEQGEKMNEFDPDAAGFMVVPRMTGG